MPKIKKTNFEIYKYIKLKNILHSPAWLIVKKLTDTLGGVKINRLLCKTLNTCTGQTMCEVFNYDEVEITNSDAASYK